MAKKNGWNADEMQGSLISDMEQEVKNGYQKIGQGGGEVAVAQQQTKTIAQTIPAAVVVGNGEPTQNINVPIPVSLHQQLKIFAAQTKQNMKDLVVVAIKDYMDHQAK